MKSLPILLLATVLIADAAEILPTHSLELSLQSRVGFDTNPDGTSGSSAALLGDDESLTFAAGLTVVLTLPGASADRLASKLTYTGEVVRFGRWAGENFSTHRVGWTGQAKAGAWKFSGDESSLFIAGSRETLASVASVNANAIAMWRERRQQWQHRLKLQAHADIGAWVVRGSGALLAYDYQTRVASGKVAFADRSDAQAGIEVGRRQGPNSLWLAGIRVGRQEQSTVALPNCEFDYASDYYRLAAGWEGRPFANTTVTVAAGPDFRHYTGAIDPRVFFHGRDRTSLWFESGIAAKLSPAVSLSGKAVRMAWLSSTGKSAYLDSSVEGALTWTLTRAMSVRFTSKVHRCDYFPAVRDDWESLVGAGATLKISDRALLAADVMRHRAWNNLDTVTEREFRRATFNLSAAVKL